MSDNRDGQDSPRAVLFICAWLMVGGLVFTLAGRAGGFMAAFLSVLAVILVRMLAQNRARWSPSLLRYGTFGAARLQHIFVHGRYGASRWPSALRKLAVSLGSGYRKVKDGFSSPLRKSTPARPDHESPPDFDWHAIERIKRESVEACLLLNEAINGAMQGSAATSTHPQMAKYNNAASETEPDHSSLQGDMPPQEVPGSATEPYPTLLTAFVTQDRWGRAEAQELARRHGRMLGAEIEAINDWAFEAYGRPLIFEENDHLDIDLDLLRQHH